MEIDIKSTGGSSSIVRGIADGAMPLIIKTIQEDQYKYPIKSAIRELASNGRDSISEKRLAIDIIQNGAEISKYYNTEAVVNDLTKDSSFNREYYDLDWLDTEDSVHIVYTEKPNELRDHISIKDTGVGLGGRRLQGYMELGYSTKRLSKTVLGFFGFGAKVAIATGAEFYKVVSNYNGKRFEFDIYGDDYVNCTPPIGYDSFNPKEIWEVEVKLPTGEIVKQHKDIYYINTTEKNSVTISFDVKNPRDNRRKYREAVKDQLAYFGDIIRFDWKDYYDTENIKFSPIEYEDEQVIIAERSPYNVPHLVLNGVNYGPIDFGEMERERMTGGIGIKADINQLEVNQSRESIKYSNKSVTYINSLLEGISDKAHKEIMENVDVSSIVGWMTVNNTSASSGNEVFNRYRGLVKRDLFSKTFITPSGFTLKSASDLTTFLNIREVNKPYEKVCLSSPVTVLKPLVVVNFDSSAYSYRKVEYIYSTLNNNSSFTYITPKSSSKDVDLTDELLAQFLIVPEVLDWDKVIVPDDYKTNIKEAEVESEEANELGITEKDLKLTARKEKRSFPSRKVIYNRGSGGYNKFIIQEQNVKDLLTAPKHSIIYGFTESRDNLLLSHIVTNKTVLLISKQYSKYFTNQLHVDAAMFNCSDNKIYMTEDFYKTALTIYIEDKLRKMDLSSYTALIPNIVDKLLELRKSLKDHTKDLSYSQREFIDKLGFRDFIQPLCKLQDFGIENLSEEELAKLKSTYGGSIGVMSIFPEEIVEKLREVRTVITDDMLEFLDSYKFNINRSNVLLKEFLDYKEVFKIDTNLKKEEIDDSINED